MLLAKFRNAINSAIEKYENLFTQEKPMSKHRSRDVLMLREIIFNETIEADAIKTQVNDHLKQMKTGWWIFVTGRSRLKTFIKEVLNDPSYSEINFLKDEILNLKSQQKEQALTLQSGLQKGQAGNNNNEQITLQQLMQNLIIIQKAYEEAKSTIAKQASELTQLRKQNDDLYQLNRSLVRANAEPEQEPDSPSSKTYKRMASVQLLKT